MKFFPIVPLCVSTTLKDCSTVRYFGSKGGFTLFELLLVITIFGIIVSIGVTAWFSMRTSQQISSTVTFLKTASKCMENYVIHSRKITPQSYFLSNCSRLDPWGNAIMYQNSGDDQNVASAATKIFRDENGDHPDTVWIMTSFGPDGIQDMVSTAALWDCSSGDDLCQTLTRNTLIYAISQ